MKNLFLLILLVAAGITRAQETQEISTGNGYNFQSFVHLEDGTQHQVANNSWDLAFNVTAGEAGVFINESVGSAAGAYPIQAFYTFSTDFSAIPDPGAFEETPLLNPEKSWSYGALNEIRNVDDPDDFGWGYRNPENQEITGENVFVVRLRDQTDLKIQIQSLIGGVYTFRYANLDGSGEVSVTINKADHSGKLMAYYSFASDGVVEIEPTGGFDLYYTRYYALLDPGNGELVPYLLTGILSGPGVEVAQVDGIDPETVMFADHQDALSPDIEVIGHDWKEFDLGNFQWLIIENRVYFVKTANNRVWKIQFTEFEGSTTGNATFEKTDLGIISSVKDDSFVKAVGVYPNPASTQFDVLISTDALYHDKATLQLFDQMGEVVAEITDRPLESFSHIAFPLDGIPPGLYFLNIRIGGTLVTEKVIVR